MVELHIKIRKRIARLAYGENFVSYNEGYKIIFDFDKEWDSIENKTARFIFGKNYIDYPFNGNEVEIPLIKNADTLEIGVYSDNLYTTTAVKFKVLKSIKDEEKIEILVPEAYPEIAELDDEDLIRVYDKSEEKIGISPLKKLFDKMGVAINTALAAAKASGEFDGKSAYSYAQDGGYTGTEAEFAAKLAAEGLDKALFVVNITRNGDGAYSADKTFEEITQAYNEGKYNIVAIMVLRTGSHIMPLLAAEKTGAVFGMVLGQTRFSFVITSNNEVQREMIQLATLKNKLPNPYPLTFTGAVSGSYDGSAPLSVEIPSGGTGGGGIGALAGLAIADNYDIELISHVIIDQDNIPTAGITVTQKDDGSPFAYDGLLIWTDAKSAASYTSFNFNGYTNYPIEMTHGNKNLLSMYITDGTTMSIIIDRVRNIIKQSHADTGNLFYPDAVFQRVPEKFTSFKIGAEGIASVKFYKAWGLTRK